MSNCANMDTIMKIHLDQSGPLPALAVGWGGHKSASCMNVVLESRKGENESNNEQWKEPQGDPLKLERSAHSLKEGGNMVSDSGGNELVPVKHL